MAMTRRSEADLITLVSLHAVLDSILEIEALVAQIAVVDVDRVAALAAEMRTLLVILLQPQPR